MIFPVTFLSYITKNEERKNPNKPDKTNKLIYDITKVDRKDKEVSIRQEILNSSLSDTVVR